MSPVAVLAGIGSRLPPRLVTNDELAARLDTSDEWIRSRTGIARRYFAPDDMQTSDLAAAAGAEALKSSGESQVDTVVVATTTPDRPCPGTAPTVASKLGLGQPAAFDVSAVCTGFLYALANAAGLIASGVSERALVVGVETFSRILDPTDRGTSTIFGDGAGAVVLRAGRPDELGALGPCTLGSDGEGVDLITVPAGPEARYFTMQGKRVFWLAVQRMSQCAQEVLRQAEWRTTDVDHLVSHQANQRITWQLADEIGIPRERSVSNIAEVGNTAAASIPLALDHARAEGLIKAGDRLLLTAFGGGLTWGAAALRWPAVGRG
ncbi:beta-ketoacyl-ACP synthase III [Streptomyces oceani]|uniref:Beta-ketoacyl-[acyl-carrier-protein] synthase III n=1 Tax=Streptomyces oceani TaxID=1075402 RepID=A0A1E7KEU4_9ACTN|nr:beta-ketoacyl-ACP synthase III [Streptomyces oceani]OEV02438.1 3-oxoacyl-ACP synthase [Streptomyces oceani]